jgi:hypothetical protein
LESAFSKLRLLMRMLNELVGETQRLFSLEVFFQTLFLVLSWKESTLKWLFSVVWAEAHGGISSLK